MHVVFLQGICGFTYTRQSDFSVFRAAVFILLELCVHLWLGADMKATSVYPSGFPCSVKEKWAKMLSVVRELSPWADVGGFFPKGGFCSSRQERDGMRAILESYDSELTPSEHSPQLSRRMREAEEMVQKLHAHNTELEVTKASRSNNRREVVETFKI